MAHPRPQVTARGRPRAWATCRSSYLNGCSRCRPPGQGTPGAWRWQRCRPAAPSPSASHDTWTTGAYIAAQGVCVLRWLARLAGGVAGAGLPAAAPAGRPSRRVHARARAAGTTGLTSCPAWPWASSCRRCATSSRRSSWPNWMLTPPCCADGCPSRRPTRCCAPCHVAGPRCCPCNVVAQLLAGLEGAHTFRCRTGAGVAPRCEAAVPHEGPTSGGAPQQRASYPAVKREGSARPPSAFICLQRRPQLQAQGAAKTLVSAHAPPHPIMASDDSEVSLPRGEPPALARDDSGDATR